ncbi:MAG: phosphotyrosine protein phosphatase [Candidatus Limivivens sp.]|nr:phosphotyrosine protein phosphatase [Candidatus Limivivens sp.]
MKRYDKLIFVSNGDTCRAPMAEAILKSKYLLEELEIESKGLVVLFPEPVNPKTEAVLKANELEMEGHASAELQQSDFQSRNLILTMTRAQEQKIYKEFENPVNVHLLTEYVGESGDIQNPIGGSLEDYAESFRNMEEIITKLVIELNEEELLC